MDLSDGIIYMHHARRRMRTKHITEEQVESALSSYHTSYGAPRLPGRPFTSTVYIGAVDGRDLKVYVEDGTHPPLVRTVAWRDDE